MKNFLLLPLVCLFSLLWISCSKDYDHGDSYIYFSLDGPTISGEYRIRAGAPPEPNITALVYPDFEDSSEETSIITFQDFDQELSVVLYAPAKKGSVLLKDDFPFSLAITRHSDGVVIVSDEVSFTFSTYKKGKSDLPFGIFAQKIEVAEGHYEGIMKYVDQQGNDVFHTIKGDLKIYF